MNEEIAAAGYDTRWHAQMDEKVEALDVAVRGNGDGKPGLRQRVDKHDDYLKTQSWILKLVLAGLLSLVMERAVSDIRVSFGPPPPQVTQSQTSTSTSTTTDSNVTTRKK